MPVTNIGAVVMDQPVQLVGHQWGLRSPMPLIVVILSIVLILVYLQINRWIDERYKK
jgi:hypothetical protein